MLRKKEKQTITRLFLLSVGALIGLDHLYEEDVTGGFLAILGFNCRFDNSIGFVGMDLPFYFQNFSFAKRF